MKPKPLPIPALRRTVPADPSSVQGAAGVVDRFGRPVREHRITVTEPIKICLI
jgi:hypothetical protein